MLVEVGAETPLAEVFFRRPDGDYGSHGGRFHDEKKFAFEVELVISSEPREVDGPLRAVVAIDVDHTHDEPRITTALHRMPNA